MKDIIETDECYEFRALLTDEESLNTRGARRSRAKSTLFAIRIRRGGNARFFYAYDDGTAVWILNGYEKKTDGIPKRELKRARRLKRKYGL